MAPLAFPCEHADQVLLPREQRDRIRSAVIHGIDEVDLIGAWLLGGDHVRAKEQRTYAEPDLFLLDALGWEENDPRIGFALNTAPAEQLRVALQRARETYGPDEAEYGPLNQAIGFALACLHDDGGLADATAEPSASGLVAVTIDRAERDLLYAAVISDLSGIGDIYIDLTANRGASALRLRHRYFDGLRVLDDLGWGPDDPGEAFAITMDPVPFINVLQRLNRLSADAVGHHIDNLLSEREAARSNANACDAIGGVLATVARQCSGVTPIAAAA